MSTLRNNDWPHQLAKLYTLLKQKKEGLPEKIRWVEKSKTIFSRLENRAGKDEKTKIGTENNIFKFKTMIALEYGVNAFLYYIESRSDLTVVLFSSSKEGESFIKEYACMCYFE